MAGGYKGTWDQPRHDPNTPGVALINTAGRGRGPGGRDDRTGHGPGGAGRGGYGEEEE